MLRCTYCGKESVVTIRKRRLCKDHFNQYYTKRIEKVLKKVPLKNKKILIALSGGKDSVAIFHFLATNREKYRIKIEGIFINLGIPEFSEKSLEICKKLAKSLDVKLNILDLYENYNKKIPDIAEKYKRVCSYCGTIKRFMINDYAYKNNFDFIITGHNMDDEIIFLKQNILSNSIEYIKRYTKFYTETLKDLKLIGKIKPQFFVSENDNKVYCKTNDLEFITDKCPYSKKSSHSVLEKFIKIINKRMDYSYSFLNFFLKINDYLPSGEVIDYKFCPNCGYPTVNKNICKFCRIITS